MWAVTCSDDIVTEHCNDNNINFLEGKLGILGAGGSFYPSNTLDRTLVVGRVFLGIPVGGVPPCSPKTRENELILSCQILSLFQTKTCHFPNPFSHAASESCTLFEKPLLCSS